MTNALMPFDPLLDIVRFDPLRVMDDFLQDYGRSPGCASPIPRPHPGGYVGNRAGVYAQGRSAGRPEGRYQGGD